MFINNLQNFLAIPWLHTEANIFEHVPLVCADMPCQLQLMCVAP